MPVETWKPVPGYEGQYEVSDFGRVKSVDRTCLGKDGREELHRGRLLKPQKMKNGYLEVYLCNGSARKHRTIHSLVAEAFLGPRCKNYDVLHADGNRENNSIENLRYDTRAENLHSTYLYGGRQATGKLSLEDVDEVRERLSRGDTCADIAGRFNVTTRAIEHIRDGRNFAWYKRGEAYGA